MNNINIFYSGNLEPDVYSVTLNAAEPTCFNVEFSSNNDMCDSDNARFALQLSLNMANPRYNVAIVQGNTTITTVTIILE